MPAHAVYHTRRVTAGVKPSLVNSPDHRCTRERVNGEFVGGRGIDCQPLVWRRNLEHGRRCGGAPPPVSVLGSSLTVRPAFCRAGRGTADAVSPVGSGHMGRSLTDGAGCVLVRGKGREPCYGFHAL